MHLALPDYLLSDFKLLENEGFKIVKRRPGSKRSIKYEDRTRSLVMDVRLPGAAWVRISTEQVRAASKTRRSDRIPGVEEILAIGAQYTLEPALPVADLGSGSDQDMTGDEIAGEFNN